MVDWCRSPEERDLPPQRQVCGRQYFTEAGTHNLTTDRWRPGIAISRTSFEVPGATELQFGDDTLHAKLSDSRRIAVPLAWYPRLLQATPDERGNWEIIAGGQHLHWPDPDEDISVEMLLTGRKSGESQTSLPDLLAPMARGQRSRPSSSAATR